MSSLQESVFSVYRRGEGGAPNTSRALPQLRTSSEQSENALENNLQRVLTERSHRAPEKPKHLRNQSDQLFPSLVGREN